MNHLFKTLTFFLLNLLSFNSSLFGQTINITCGPQGCVGATPGPTLEAYLADMTNFTSCNNGSSCRYKWEVTNGIIIASNSTTYEGDGENSITVKWNNVNANGTVKVTTAKRVSALQGCSSCPVGLTQTKTLPIKYLGNPGNIKINGVEYTGSYQLNCGKSPITVSVSPAANATAYSWSYPSGWIQSGSGSTITLTPHANSGGTIKVSASRADVPSLTSTSELNITRPIPTKPVINSPDILLCSPQTISATASNATSYNWTTTGGITANSPGNTNSAQITGVSDGTVQVSATSSVCAMTTAASTPINVKKSAPKPASLLVTANGGGSPDFMCSGAGVMLNAYTSEPGTVFGNWKTSDPANSILNGNGGSAYFNSYVNNCYGIDITVSNCFGAVQKGITICVDNCAKPMPVFSLFPNPASDYLNIVFEEVTDIASLPATLKMYSESSQKEVKAMDLADVYSSADFMINKTISLRVDDLPRGSYFLHLVGDGNTAEKVRVVLK